ncbi:MAG: hypothetical protein ACD_58C00158G0002 [uncultured bacterium]|nr:MAG: hypothetical protein ACD_58C00158G0002 [uncultured bacterium]
MQKIAKCYAKNVTGENLENKIMKTYFYKGYRDILSDHKEDGKDNLDLIKKEILKIFDVKNLSFLIGAGCSSLEIDKENNGKKEKIQIGIPVMSILASDFYQTLNAKDSTYIKNTLKIDLSKEPFKNNLEKLLEVLYSYKFLLEKQGKDIKRVNAFIKKVNAFLLDKCKNEENNKAYSDILDLYKLFYKKLIYRDNNLSKTNIFTTNYDLYSESALDTLGVLYCNGFSGFVERSFNPAVFNYAFAEQMELSNNKWNVIDNFIYLYKLHGSINWIESEEQNHLFNVREVQDLDKVLGTRMIYPTPMKHMATLASPYSDLFREFQKKIMQDKTVLVVVGYSFSDEHINNLIYQALTIPTFRLVVFQDETKEKIKQLKDLNDPRIWIIGGEDSGGSKVYYFDYIVKNILPDIDEEKIEESIDKVLKSFFKNKFEK